MVNFLAEIEYIILARNDEVESVVQRILDLEILERVPTSKILQIMIKYKHGDK